MSANEQPQAMVDIEIDPEFQSLIPPLSTEDREQLESNLLREGCRDCLVVWNGKLIDGHHRYEICKHNDIRFGVMEMRFDGAADAKRWILLNQLGRRNLTPFQRTELALKLEPTIKKQAVANWRASGGTVSPKRRNQFPRILGN